MPRAGRRRAATRVGFDLPLPDFTDCNFAPRAHGDWVGIATRADPSAHSTDAGVRQVLSADRCRRNWHTSAASARTRWPRGELNLPRALVTEKAYPENEAVLTTTIAASGPAAMSHGSSTSTGSARATSIEVAVPLALQRTARASGSAGSATSPSASSTPSSTALDAGTILSASGRGGPADRQGDAGPRQGRHIFEPFVAVRPDPARRRLPAGPGRRRAADRHTTAPDDEAFWRVALGKTFIQRPLRPHVVADGRAPGRARARTTASRQWDIVPQMQVTLSTAPAHPDQRRRADPLNDAAGATRRC